jgi:hypothetical protein
LSKSGVAIGISSIFCIHRNGKVGHSIFLKLQDILEGEGRTMSETKRRGRPKGPRPPKRQFPLKLDEETRAQLAAAAYWTRQSANAIVEEGLGVVLRWLQEEHNGGQPFPPRPGQRAFAEAPGASEDTAGRAAGGATQGGKTKRRRGGPRKAK